MPKTPTTETNESKKELGFVWWNVFGLLNLILGTILIFSVFGTPNLAVTLTLVLINVVTCLAVLSYNRWALLLLTVVTVNPLVWIINGIYLKNRWRHPKVNPAYSVPTGYGAQVPQDGLIETALATHTPHVNPNVDVFSPPKPVVPETDLYSLAADEIDQGNVEKGLWNKLFAEADGDEGRTRARYLKARVEQMRAA